MRVLIAACLAGLLAGCAPGAFEAPTRGDPATCLDLFRTYDRAARIYPNNSFGTDDAPATVLSAGVSRPARMLITHGCLTDAADLDGIPELSRRLAGHQVVDGGAPIRPTALHIGIVTGIGDEREVSRFFRGLGYQTRGVGAPTLGRRIYVGPFVSQGALDEAIGIAREAGFVAPFPAPRTRF